MAVMSSPAFSVSFA